jgi:hypothetical protein
MGSEQTVLADDQAMMKRKKKSRRRRKEGWRGRKENMKKQKLIAQSGHLMH